MKQILVVLSMLALWAGLAAPADDPTANTLTSKEKAEGWIVLFDGKTLDGWGSRGGVEWRGVEGAIMTDSPKGGGLFTTREFGDFILRAEFRTTNDINSGIYLRMAPPQTSPSSEPKAKKTSSRLGYELQIRDTPHPGGYNTGSLVDYLKASEAKIVSGQWNSFEVTAKGDHYRHLQRQESARWPRVQVRARLHRLAVGPSRARARPQNRVSKPEDQAVVMAGARFRPGAAARKGALSYDRCCAERSLPVQAEGNQHISHRHRNVLFAVA